MTRSDSLILPFFLGSLFGLIVGLSTEDWRSSAASDEQRTCPEKPDQAAFMGRKPGEAHTVEACLYVMRYGDPRWVPEFSHPLKPPITPKPKEPAR